MPAGLSAPPPQLSFPKPSLMTQPSVMPHNLVPPPTHQSTVVPPQSSIIPPPPTCQSSIMPTQFPPILPPIGQSSTSPLPTGQYTAMVSPPTGQFTMMSTTSRTSMIPPPTGQSFMMPLSIGQPSTTPLTKGWVILYQLLLLVLSFSDDTSVSEIP